MFEQEVRAAVNQRLGRLGVVSVCRLDSKSTDGLQVVDLLTSAVAFEFRQQVKMAGSGNPKAELSRHVRERYGVASCLGGCKKGRLNVAIYKAKGRSGGSGTKIRTRRPPVRGS